MTVNQAISTTTLTVSKNSQVMGKPDTARVTATVKLDAGSPSGKVVFRVDGHIVDTEAARRGRASYQLSKHLSVGQHQVTAEFLSDTPAGVSGSVSGTVTITVRRA